jgi:hypothetical protein
MPILYVILMNTRSNLIRAFLFLPYGISTLLRVYRQVVVICHIKSNSNQIGSYYFNYNNKDIERIRQSACSCD